VAETERCMEIRSYSTDDESAVISLWERCGLIRPWNDPKKDIARKIAIDPNLLLVGIEGGSVIGTIMIGYESHRGWINYLAIDPDHRRKGFARQLMAAAEKLLVERGCPKANLQVRAGNREAVDFYTALGYQVDNVISFGKRLNG
jgi:ribosomal protein S18 acetylase RimI-like enzyme